jgi:arsenite methyltransferase
MEPKYLAYKFEDTREFISTFDELPLWSASFGLLLFKHLELKPNLTVLDIGSGAGFPLLELAQRLGPSCTCYGLDPWTNANNRANEKIRNYGITNIKIIEGSASKIPFDDSAIDLIVSNLGINNFEQPEEVFKECCRVLKPGGKLALTTNLNGHWQEFYNVFEEILQKNNRPDLLAKLKAHQEHRGTTATITKLYAGAGMNVTRTFEDKFEMKFLNGSAFLNHYFVKLGWLSSWRDLIPEELQASFFSQIEERLNEIAADKGVLNLTVPMAYMEGQK